MAGTFLPADADGSGAAILAHWGVETSLHWVLDVNFGEDDCRIRKKNAPATLNALRKVPSTESIKSRRMLAGWGHDFLEKKPPLSMTSSHSIAPVRPLVVM